MKPDHGPTQVQERMVHDEVEVLSVESSRLVLSTLFNIIVSLYEYECIDMAPRMLIAHLIHQLTSDQVHGHNFSIPGLWELSFRQTRFGEYGLFRGERVRISTY